MVYHKIPHLGAVYAEVQQSQAGKKWFEIDHEDGETFVWIGRFHIILTPWRRLVAGLAAAWSFMTGPTQLFWGLKSSSAAVMAVVSAAAEPAAVVTFGAGSAATFALGTSKADASIEFPPAWEALLEWDANQRSLEASVRVARVTLSTSQ